MSSQQLGLAHAEAKWIPIWTRFVQSDPFRDIYEDMVKSRANLSRLTVEKWRDTRSGLALGNLPHHHSGS